jgi:hypothetical protein
MGFFETNFFSEIVTIFVGGFIFVAYMMQRWNHRRDAANVVLGEIRQAQSRLQRVQEHVARFRTENGPEVEIGLIPSEIKLMPIESWSQYKHLFARRMDHPAFDTISSFFDHAKSYDSAVDYNNGSFAKNEDSIRSNIARMTMDTVTKGFSSLPTDSTSDDYITNHEEKVQEIIKKVQANEAIYRRNISLAYSPRKPIQDAQTELSILGNLDMSLGVLRLKKITWTRP